MSQLKKEINLRNLLGILKRIEGFNKEEIKEFFEFLLVKVEYWDTYNFDIAMLSAYEWIYNCNPELCILKQCDVNLQFNGNGSPEYEKNVNLEYEKRELNRKDYEYFYDVTRTYRRLINSHNLETTVGTYYLEGVRHIKYLDLVYEIHFDGLVAMLKEKFNLRDSYEFPPMPGNWGRYLDIAKNTTRRTSHIKGFKHWGKIKGRRFFINEQAENAELEITLTKNDIEREAGMQRLRANLK